MKALILALALASSSWAVAITYSAADFSTPLVNFTAAAPGTGTFNVTSSSLVDISFIFTATRTGIIGDSTVQLPITLNGVMTTVPLMIHAITGNTAILTDQSSPPRFISDGLAVAFYSLDAVVLGPLFGKPESAPLLLEARLVVPEPSSYALTLAGLVLLYRVKKSSLRGSHSDTQPGPAPSRCAFCRCRSCPKPEHSHAW